MKKICLLLAFGTMMSVSSWAGQESTSCAQVTFGPGVLLVCDGTTIETFDPAELLSEDATRGKKEKQNIATVFAGLAGSCAHVSEIVAAQSDREKKQGILNLIGTIFSVAAQLIGSSHRVCSSERDAKLFIQMSTNQGATAITLQFFDVLALEKDPTFFIKDNELLTKLFKLNSDDERIAMIEKCLQTEEQAYLFWHSLAGTLQDYISYYIDSTLNIFNQAIAYTHRVEDQDGDDEFGEFEIVGDYEFGEDECCEISENDHVEAMAS